MSDTTKLPTIMLLTPCYHAEVGLNYLTSVRVEVPKLERAGYRIRFAITVGDAVQRQRNTLADQFLRSECDYALWVDSDTGFRAEDIQRMLERDLPMQVVNYPKREYYWQQASGETLATVDALKNALMQGTVVLQPEPHRWLRGAVEIKFAGFGLVLVKREVFETMIVKGLVPKMADGRYRFFEFELLDGADVGEDYHFCELTRRAGCKVYLDPAARASHLGLHIFDGNPRPMIQTITDAQPTEPVPADHAGAVATGE